MLTKTIYQSTERINIESIIKLVLQIFEISKSIILLRQKMFFLWGKRCEGIRKF